MLFRVNSSNKNSFLEFSSSLFLPFASPHILNILLPFICIILSAFSSKGLSNPTMILPPISITGYSQLTAFLDHFFCCLFVLLNVYLLVLHLIFSEKSFCHPAVRTMSCRINFYSHFFTSVINFFVRFSSMSFVIDSISYCGDHPQSLLAIFLKVQTTISFLISLIMYSTVSDNP